MLKLRCPKPDITNFFPNSPFRVSLVSLYAEGIARESGNQQCCWLPEPPCASRRSMPCTIAPSRTSTNDVARGVLDRLIQVLSQSKIPETRLRCRLWVTAKRLKEGDGQLLSPRRTRKLAERSSALAACVSKAGVCGKRMSDMRRDKRPLKMLQILIMSHALESCATAFPLST